jgi:hypothetical protein
VSAVTTPIRPSAMPDSVPFGDSRIRGTVPGVPPTTLSVRRHRAIYVVRPVYLSTGSDEFVTIAHRWLYRFLRYLHSRPKVATECSRKKSKNARVHPFLTGSRAKQPERSARRIR